MSDLHISDRIADIILEDHIALMEQNRELRDCLHRLLDEVYPAECWTPQHIELEKQQGNMLAPVIERAYAVLRGSDE